MYRTWTWPECMLELSESSKTLPRLGQGPAERVGITHYRQRRWVLGRPGQLSRADSRDGFGERFRVFRVRYTTDCQGCLVCVGCFQSAFKCFVRVRCAAAVLLSASSRIAPFINARVFYESSAERTCLVPALGISLLP